MTAEPRDVEELVPRNAEEIAALVRRVQSLPTAAAELVGREFVAARLAAVDRENAELRGDVERLRESQFAIGQALVNEQLRSERAESQLAAVERDRDEARSERDDAGLLWGRHYNDAMGALETQLAAARAQLAEVSRDYERVAATASEVYCAITDGALSYPTYDARTILAHYEDDVQKIIDEECAPLTERANAAEARLEAVRALRSRWEAERTYLSAEQEPIAAAYIELLDAALSAAPQPEPDDGCAECTESGTRNCVAGCKPEPPASDEPTGRSD